MRQTPGLLAVRNFTDIQAFGEYGSVSTELFIVSTIIIWLSIYQLYGIGAKRTVRYIIL